MRNTEVLPKGKFICPDCGNVVLTEGEVSSWAETTEEHLSNTKRKIACPYCHEVYKGTLKQEKKLGSGIRL